MLYKLVAFANELILIVYLLSKFLSQCCHFWSLEQDFRHKLYLIYCILSNNFCFREISKF